MIVECRPLREFLRQIKQSIVTNAHRQRQCERTLFVSAVDAKGEPVEGLSVNDCIVTEDGRRREVLRVSRAIEPMDIAILIDNSAAAEGSISVFRTALGKFVA